MTLPPPDWYADPHDAGQLRYWDGQRWTEHRAAMAQPQERRVDDSFRRTDRRTVDGGSATGSVQIGAREESERRAVKVPLFGARSVARQHAEEADRLRAELDRLGALDVAELAALRDRLTHEVTELRREATSQRVRLEGELTDLRQRIVVTREEEVLQELGVYEYHHPLSDSVAYREELERLKDQIKTMVQRDGGAIESTTSWMVNGSAVEGRKMVRDFSKLMLRAYNAEADNLVRGMKPYKVASAKDRLDKVAFTIERLGKTMSIRVSAAYHRLRFRELELTADYQEMLAREKEHERAERERLREERKVRQEIERERERLNKERQHYLNALAAMEAKGDHDAVARMRAQLEDLDRALHDVDYRAANVKAGYVYVISNVGAFGESMVKVGMTRRLEPMDRIRELSDASVPFNFDVHALFFSDNAADIEAQMHRRLGDRRVNLVNLRREFFYATPSEAREHLRQLTGDLLQFQELPEAVEFHRSRR
jgi:hypothetical protein